MNIEKHGIFSKFPFCLVKKITLCNLTLVKQPRKMNMGFFFYAVFQGIKYHKHSTVAVKIETQMRTGLCSLYFYNFILFLCFHEKK